MIDIYRWLSSMWPSGFAPGWSKTLPDGSLAVCGNRYVTWNIGDITHLSCYVPLMWTERLGA